MISAPKDIFGPNIFRIFVQELGGPRRVATMLEVHERTVWNWLRKENPPRMAALALYWETAYGRSLINTDQVREIRLLYAHLRMLERQIAEMLPVIAELRKQATDSANDSVYKEFTLQRFVAPNTYGYAK